MRYSKYIAGTILLLLTWAVLVCLSIYLGWFSRPLADVDDIESFFKASKELAAKRNPPVVAFALIKNGQLYGDYYGSSVGAVPNADTLFPIASMSKWVTAYGAMALSERGQLDIEHPVPNYLHRWHLPPSEYDNNKVTARLLLSHRAGIHDELGFGDYLATETLPTLEESLSRPRTSSDRVAMIAVTSEPGSGWDYSGGSYHLMELIVEEITGKKFGGYMNDAVFKPLGMTRSTYDYIATLDNSVRSYTTTGEFAPQYRYASAGATALNTSIRDLSQFVRAQIPQSGVEGVLSQRSIEAMRQPVTTYFGQPIFGIGTMLSSKTDRGNFIFGHDGANDPAINSSVKINPETGDAIIALTNGSVGFASELTSEWSYWQTDRPYWMFLFSKIGKIKFAVLCGWGVILLAAASAFVLRRKKLPVAMAD